MSYNAVLHHTRTHRHTDTSTQCLQAHLSKGKVTNDVIPLPNRMADLQVLCSGHGESSGILKPVVDASDVDKQVLASSSQPLQVRTSLNQNQQQLLERSLRMTSTPTLPHTPHTHQCVWECPHSHITSSPAPPNLTLPISHHPHPFLPHQRLRQLPQSGHLF